jgi:hypothetical protein
MPLVTQVTQVTLQESSIIMGQPQWTHWVPAPRDRSQPTSIIPESCNLRTYRASSGMLRRVALLRTSVSEELNASFIRMTRFGELGTTLAVASNRRSMKEALSSSETSVLTRATRQNSPEDAILYSQSRENLKSYLSNSCTVRIHNPCEHSRPSF